MPDRFRWQAPPICLQHSFSSADSRSPGTVQAITGPPNSSTVRIDTKMEQRFIRSTSHLRFCHTRKVSSHFCPLQSLGQYPRSFFSRCQTPLLLGKCVEHLSRRMAKRGIRVAIATPKDRAGHWHRQDAVRRSLGRCHRRQLRETSSIQSGG